jgi:TM2 domain-containing membrane protein YozV
MGTMPYANAEAVFHQQYSAVRRDEVVGVLLAILLGGFGAHHFYLGRVGLGILYIVFSWTGIPWVLGWIECFFMPGRVRVYNAVQAAGLAAMLGIAIPGWVGYHPGWVAPGYAPPPVYVSVQTTPADGTLVACASCGRANASGARFCSGCGGDAGLGS